MLKIKEIDVPGYERVIEAIDPKHKLHCFIAIHNTTLGPALGGIRIYPYHDPKDALKDVLRLAEGMTKKSALAQLGLGGGKSVIIADPQKEKTHELLHAFGRLLDRLQGMYIGAEDVGSSMEDMAVIRTKTPYIAALPSESSSGDPSRFTAWGVFRGIEAIATKLWGSTSLEGKTIAVQGLGNVGLKLVEYLFWSGANLIVTDIDKARLERVKFLYGAESIPPENFHRVECDILSPCALGGTLNKETISELHCKGIGGAANNQLLSQEDGEILFRKGILYAPDFIINSGGIINAAMEFEVGGYNSKTSRNKVNLIYDTLLQVFNRSQKEGKSTNQVAEELAAFNLAHGVSKRTTPIHFHH